MLVTEQLDSWIANSFTRFIMIERSSESESVRLQGQLRALERKLADIADSDDFFLLKMGTVSRYLDCTLRIAETKDGLHRLGLDTILRDSDTSAMDDLSLPLSNQELTDGPLE